MKKIGSSLKTIMSKFKRFCELCTLHGMYYFYQTSPFWIYCMWTIIIGSSLYLCVYLSYMIWWRFVNNPTFTVVESTHYSIDSISFPAISICDSDTIHFPNTDNITRILNHRGFDQDDIHSFYNSFTDIKLKNKSIEDHVTKMHKLFSEIGYTYDTLISQLSTPCSVIIRQCVWRSKKFECSKLFRKVLTVTGYCCQFDVKYFREHVEDNINFNAGVEIPEGLDLTVNTQSLLANGSSVEGFINMFVFDLQNKLSQLDSPITLTGSTYFDVTVAVWAIDSSDDVKRLSLKNRKCFLSTDTSRNADSFEGCIMLNVTQKVVSQCRCLPFNYQSIDVEYFPVCTWEELKCVYNILDDIQYTMLESGCYQNCDHIQYETEITSMKIDRNVGYLQPGDSRVVVHFADNTCIKYRREVLFTWDQMLANLGGIFGLCLGGSIVTVIELMWFLLEILQTVMRLQKKVEPETKIKNMFAMKKEAANKF